MIKEKAEPKKPALRKIPSRAPDYNPDREGHVQHRFIVLDATKKRREYLEVGDIKIPLKNGMAMIKDEKLARDLQIEHRFDATVSRVRYPDPVSDGGHRYFFGQMPAMPWHKYDENGKRIKE